MRLAALCPALLLALALPAMAEETGAPTAEYLAQKAALEEMVQKRDIDLFELEFQPGVLGRVNLRDRTGKDWVYNYLTFRVRNQIALDQAQLATKAKGYNEVLQSIATQYDKAKIQQEGGVSLRIDGVAGADGMVLERQEARAKTRTVALTALAYDENGTRLRLLDEKPGAGPQEAFHFPDLGDPTPATAMRLVKERIEEKEGRKLLTADELRAYPLPPFDGATRVEAADITDAKHDFHGWFVGEAHGVIIFSKLSDFGDRFTIQVQGLCNKLRFVGNEAEAGKPANYFNAKVRRRTYVLHFERPGDEYYRDLDRFRLVQSGYEWVDTFQRTDTKRMSSYARYFLDNIVSENGQMNAEVQQQFWTFHDGNRARYGDKLPDIKNEKTGE
jgi:hypothetical protein